MHKPLLVSVVIEPVVDWSDVVEVLGDDAV